MNRRSALKTIFLLIGACALGLGMLRKPKQQMSVDEILQNNLAELEIHCMNLAIYGSSCLHVIDDIRATDDIFAADFYTSGGFYYSSDRRLKKDIKDLDSSSILKILELNPVEFRWKENDKIGLGFIAQDLEKIYPELVSIDDSREKTSSINYVGLIAPLVKTIQEQQFMIEEQDEKINKLEDLYNQQQERTNLIEEQFYGK